MAKNIVICCDGTGNEFGGDCNSNVVKLYSTLIIDDEQRGYYHPGVGTMGAPTARNWIEREWSRVKGLAFGAGLLSNVADAYRYLMDVYAPGDHVSSSALVVAPTRQEHLRRCCICTGSFARGTKA